DRDGDGIGDVCDNCAAASNANQSDLDHDGVGDVCDDCPSIANGNQADADADGIGDVCDNCPHAAHADQKGSNGDGSGDACQPVVSIGAIVSTGSTLEANVIARDPQGEPLSGSVDFFTDAFDVTLPDALEAQTCDGGYLPQGVRGRGIGYTNA